MQTFTNQASLSYDGKTTKSNVATGQIVEALTVAKTTLTPEYSRGVEKTFVVTLTNSGTPAMPNLTISDNLGAYTYTQPTTSNDSTQTAATLTLYPLTYTTGSILYYQNGVQQPTPTVTTTAGLVVTGITVPANGNASLIYKATVNSFAPLAAGSSITNTVTVTGNSLSSPLTATCTINVESDPVLSIVKSISPRQVTGTGPVTYTLLLQNSGNVAAGTSDQVQITDTFQPILSNISVKLNGSPFASSNYSYNTATGLFSTNAGVLTVPAAAFTRNPTTGAIIVTPGETTLAITGNLSGSSAASTSDSDPNTGSDAGTGTTASGTATA